MNIIRRICAITLIFILCAVQLNIPVFAESVTPFDAILGVYDGSYTATQGVTGLTLSIYRKSDLLNDNALLQKFADTANLCGSAYTESTAIAYTADDIKKIVAAHPDNYIALFNYFPMVDENGVGPNPDVEEGLYTMTISYDSASSTYELTGSQWIQHDIYNYADLKNVTFDNNTLSGDIYGEHANFFQMEYSQVGNFSVSRDHMSGVRIDFNMGSNKLSVNDSFEIQAIVKNHNGSIYTEQANIHWFSNNESVATVSGENWSGDSEYVTGTITAVSEGATEIYAELDNKRVATCIVIIYYDPLVVNTSYGFQGSNSVAANKEFNVVITANVTNTDSNPIRNVSLELALPDSIHIKDYDSLVVDIPEISSNGTYFHSWEVTIDNVSSNGFKDQYRIITKSDQTVEAIKYKTVFIDPLQDNTLDLNADIWEFLNFAIHFYTKNELNEYRANNPVTSENNTDESEDNPDESEDNPDESEDNPDESEDNPDESEDNPDESEDSDINPPYFINTEHYNLLTLDISNIEKTRIDNALADNWTGSCFGMVAICALVKIGHLDIKDIDPTAKNLRDADYPEENEEIHSLINYYQSAQYLDPLYVIKEAQIELINGGAEPYLISELVNAVSNVRYGGCPVIIGFFYLNSVSDWVAGHAILAYGIEYGEYTVQDLVTQSDGTCETNTYNKRLLIYDPDNYDHNGKLLSFSEEFATSNTKKPVYMYINSDNTKWIIVDGYGVGYCQSRVDGKFQYASEGYFHFYSDPVIIDTAHIDDNVINYNSRITTYINTALRITYNNGEGVSEEVMAQVLNVFGPNSDNVVAYVNDLNGENFANSISYFFLDDVSEVTVEPVDEGAGLDLVYEFTDVYYAVQSEDGQRATFSEDKAFSLDCSGSYELNAVYNEGEYSSAWYDYNITGRVDGTISMSQDADGYTIVSGDDLRNVTVTVKNRSDSETQTVSTGNDSFMITGEGAELIILTDNDNDGIYETQLEGRKVANTTTRSVDVKAIVISVIVSLGMLALFIWVYDYCKNRKTT